MRYRSGRPPSAPAPIGAAGPQAFRPRPVPAVTDRVRVIGLWRKGPYRRDRSSAGLATRQPMRPEERGRPSWRSGPSMADSCLGNRSAPRLDPDFSTDGHSTTPGAPPRPFQVVAWPIRAAGSATAAARGRNCCAREYLLQSRFGWSTKRAAGVPSALPCCAALEKGLPQGPADSRSGLHRRPAPRPGGLSPGGVEPSSGRPARTPGKGAGEAGAGQGRRC